MKTLGEENEIIKLKRENQHQGARRGTSKHITNGSNELWLQCNL